jgi:hypothetical protein
MVRIVRESIVIPAAAGIQGFRAGEVGELWVPAFAGMTKSASRNYRRTGIPRSAIRPLAWPTVYSP